MKDRCQKRYSVYDSKTEMPLIIYGTSKECAKAMGVTLNSFYRYLIRVREGKIKLHKWLVYEDEVEELEEEAEVQETAAAPTVDENAELKGVNEKRLIYLEDVLEEIDDAISNIAYTSPYQNDISTMVSGMERVRGVVEDATTVDAVEMVRGRWVSSGCGFDVCSECRKVYADGYLTAMGIKPRTQFNYCPNCGAKMDGGNENGKNN